MEATRRANELDSVLAFIDILDATAERVVRQIAMMDNHHVASAMSYPSKGSHRATRVLELKSIGAKYEAQATILASIETRLAEQRHKLKKLSADYHNAVCPIGSLPIEILHDIMLLASDGRQQNAIPIFPLVCKYWNGALACLKVMWNQSKARTNDLDSLTYQLRRAGPKANVTLTNPTVPMWVTEKALRDKVTTLTVTDYSPPSILNLIMKEDFLNLSTLTLKHVPSKSISSSSSESDRPEILDCGFLELPTGHMPKLRRINLDALNFYNLRISYYCNASVLEVQNADLYFPYLLRSFNELRKLTHLRLIKVIDSGPEDDLDDEAFFSHDELPKALQIATLSHCDWETNRSFFEAIPWTSTLRELRVTFPQFESDCQFSERFAGVPISEIPFSEMSTSATCCLAFVDTLSSLKHLSTLCITGPDTLLIRVIQAMFPPELLDNGQPDPLPYASDHQLCLPSLKHLEVKLSNGMVCDPRLRTSHHHCHCSVTSSGFPSHITKLLKHRAQESAPRLEHLKVSTCLVEDLELVKTLVKKFSTFKCQCVRRVEGSTGSNADTHPSASSQNAPVGPPMGMPNPLEMLFAGIALAGQMSNHGQ